MFKYNMNALTSMEIYELLNAHFKVLEIKEEEVRNEIGLLYFELAKRGHEAEMRYGIKEQIRVGDTAKIINHHKDQHGLEGVISDITNRTVVLKTPQGIVKKRKENIKKVYNVALL